jgi:chitodextrinase
MALHTRSSKTVRVKKQQEDRMVTPSVVPAADTVARSRPRRAVPVAVVAAVAVLGLAAGLVIWAPWKSPPLLRPAGLAAGPVTTSSVTFRWSRPAAGAAPDRYLIMRDGKMVGSVSGTVTSYQGTGLAPDTQYQYRVAAARGGKRSALSSVLAVATSAPPASAARLEAPWTVIIKVVRGRAAIRGAKAWSEVWLTTPECPAGPCDVKLSGTTNQHYKFKVTLTRTDAVYRGKTRAVVFPCGGGSAAFPVRSTLAIRLTVHTAQVQNGAWTAATWTGTMSVSSPYSSSGNIYCNASKQKMSLSGSF